MSHNPTTESENDRIRDYRRGMLRSMFVSLFWGVLQHKKEKEKYTLQSLATRLKINKSTISRWFSPELPNWELDTVADIATELNLEIQLIARDRTSGVIYTPSGRQDTATFRTSPAVFYGANSVITLTRSAPSFSRTTRIEAA